MRLKLGITGKLFLWFSIFVCIFYGTLVTLFFNINQIVEISENIVNKNYRISSASKKMIENLLLMEESEKKYQILHKDDYIRYFLTARKEFAGHLNEILQLPESGIDIPSDWRALSLEYRDAFDDPKSQAELQTGMIWIPETTINQWIERITKIQTENEKNIESAMHDLTHKGQISARNGIVGLIFSTLIGLVGVFFLSSTMIKPLRTLIDGIRSIAKDGSGKTIRIRSKDEFGKVADAFNEMALQLKEEEHMRSDFISMLSHEIRTPLTSIRESVNMIAEEVMGGINSKQRKFLEIASVEIGRICELLNHLMQVSRLEAGALKIQKRALATETFVSKCLKPQLSLAKEKQIDIITQITSKTPNIMADPEHLSRVFHNLIDNAIKFSSRNSHIQIQAETDKLKKHIVFSVTDSGQGIPAEEQQMIFNKYYQARDTRDHMDGVGLGLNISKHIIEAHGGDIWVKSNHGTGSTFYFSIPIAQDEF